MWDRTIDNDELLPLGHSQNDELWNVLIAPVSSVRCLSLRKPAVRFELYPELMRECRACLHKCLLFQDSGDGE